MIMCQPDSGEMALEVVDQLVRSSAIDIIVVDSVAALVPRAEIEGEIGAVQGVQNLLSEPIARTALNARRGSRVHVCAEHATGHVPTEKCAGADGPDVCTCLLWRRSGRAGAAHEPCAAEDHSQRLQVQLHRAVPQPAQIQGVPCLGCLQLPPCTFQGVFAAMPHCRHGFHARRCYTPPQTMHRLA